MSIKTRATIEDLYKVEGKDDLVVDAEGPLGKVTLNPNGEAYFCVGTLKPGAPGDVTILDLDRTYTVEPEKLYSRSKNTPFGGWELRGAAVATVVDGRIVMRDGIVSG